MTANLTCAMGDVRRVSKGATAWCREHPGSAVVPMYATGHATIYSWTCVGSELRITQAEKTPARSSPISGRRRENRLRVRSPGAIRDTGLGLTREFGRAMTRGSGRFR
jgi:hypothetical protein